jgi:transcriptional regulator with XRE-family HTH domain
MIDRDPILSDEALGARLKLLRQHRDLTQEGLAKLSGLAPDTVRRMEKGDFSPSFDTLVKVACGLGVPPAALLCDDYDLADDLASLTRSLPEREQLMALALLGILRMHSAMKAAAPARIRGEGLHRG